MRLNVSAHEQEVAQLLIDENIKSVNYRYSEAETSLIEYDRGAPILSAIEAIKAAQCLRYQSCEHSDYEESIAFKLIEAIISDAIPRLEGYESASWAIADKVTA
jgi:tRNA splicing ligase